MDDRRNELGDRLYDIAVVGGGIFGAALAWAAARRGYAVALVERGDFGGATSSNHFRFIHGGIRYLQHLDLARVRESCEEKSALIRLAPHFCYPMPIVLPTYGHGRRGKGLLRAAMAAYDLLTLDRNRGIRDPARRTPRGTTIGRDELLAMAPGVPAEGLTGAAVFHDGQMYNPARLVLAFLESAARAGAVIANYVQVDRLLCSSGNVIGCAATDLRNGGRVEVRARMVINAAGPWAHRLLESEPGLAMRPAPSFSRDLAIIVDRQVSPTHAIGCQARSGDSDAVLDRGARHLFLVPWRGRTLVGVWHGYSEVHPEKVGVSLEELRGYLDEINGAYAGLELSLEDIRMINTGLILFGSQAEQGTGGRHSFSKRALIHDHVRDGVEGLITIIGDRATVARRVAERTLDRIGSRLGGAKRSARDGQEPLRGGEFEDFSALVKEIEARLPESARHTARALAHNHGAAYGEVLACAETEEHRLPVADSKVLAAEVIHAARRELAVTLEDVVVRRTELGSAGDPGTVALRLAARLAGRELGWDDAEQARQVAALQDLYRNYGPWKVVDRTAQLEAVA
jgi:glycerol-3-phosphate dehydrogenase